MAEKASSSKGRAEDADATPAPEDVTFRQMLAKLGSPSQGLLWGVTLVVALVLNGLFQEKIMTIPYGPHNQHFFQFFKVPSYEASLGHDMDAPFLAMWTRLVGFVIATVMVFVQGERLKNQAPLWKYLIIAITASLSSIMQYESLKYLAFTVQILAKCCKTLPVLIYGRVINGKRYVLVDWVCAWLLLIGSIIFYSGGPVDSNYSKQRPYGEGVVLLILFVVLDGVVSWQQSHLYKSYEVSKYNQMFWVNMISALFCFIWSIGSGRFFDELKEGATYPVLFADISFFGGTAITAQWCTHNIVESLGASIFLAFLNVRMTISYILSIYFYKHYTDALQIIALSIVGFALCFRSFVSFAVWCQSESEPSEEAPLLEKESDFSSTIVEPLRKIGRRLTYQVTGGSCASCWSMCKV